jgi:hypothetical protein
MDTLEQALAEVLRFNVVEVTGARYRLCNVSLEFADGFASGIITERRAAAGARS